MYSRREVLVIIHVTKGKFKEVYRCYAMLCYAPKTMTPRQMERTNRRIL
jgi:hypothetical protein